MSKPDLPEDRPPGAERRSRPGSDWLDEVRFDAHGLAPAIAQDADTGRVLMIAWVNAEALRETAACGFAVYWSRSRGRLWRKHDWKNPAYVRHSRVPWGYVAWP